MRRVLSDAQRFFDGRAESMKIPVAVIDSGIKRDVFSLPDEIHETDVSRVIPFRFKHSVSDTRLHGTITSSIIHKYSPEILLYSIQVFPDGSLITSRQTLLRALKWCLKKRIPIINLSLGTTDKTDFQDIENMIDKLVDNRQVVVSAFQIDGADTMPAMHPKVFGVLLDDTLQNNEYYALPGTANNYCASSRHLLIRQDGSEYKTPVNTSYAAPTITAAIVNCIKEHPWREQGFITDYLKNNGARPGG